MPFPCSYCKQLGHKIIECEKITCKICFKLGHHFKKCDKYPIIKLLWVGKLKEKNCLLSLLPREILIEIVILYKDPFRDLVNTLKKFRPEKTDVDGWVNVGLKAKNPTIFIKHKKYFEGIRCYVGLSRYPFIIHGGDHPCGRDWKIISSYGFRKTLFTYEFRKRYFGTSVPK